MTNSKTPVGVLSLRLDAPPPGPRRLTDIKWEVTPPSPISPPPEALVSPRQSPPRTPLLSPNPPDASTTRKPSAETESVAFSMAIKVLRRRISVDRLETFTLRQKIYCLLDVNAPCPSQRYANASDVISKLLLGLLVLSILTFCVESLPQYIHADDPVIWGIEIFVAVVYTMDFTMRLATCPSRMVFLKNKMAWIDALSFLPFYFEIILVRSSYQVSTRESAVFDVLRLLRVVRVVKFFTHSPSLIVAITTLSESGRDLRLVLFIFCLAISIFSHIMFIAEQDEQDFDVTARVWVRTDGTLSPFQSIFHCCWWCIVTLSTLGYGDAVPISTFGRCVAALTMYIGVLFVSFPIVLLTHHYKIVIKRLVEDNLPNRPPPPPPPRTPLETTPKRVFVPVPNTVASNFVFWQSTYSVKYVGEHALGQKQYRYRPLMVPHPDHGMRVVGGRFLRVSVLLDSPAAGRMAMRSLSDSIPLLSEDINESNDVCAYTVNRVTIDIPRLDTDRYAIQPKCFASPGNVLVINIVAATPEDAQYFFHRRCLYYIMLTASCYAPCGNDGGGGSRHDVCATIPLAMY